MTHLPLPFDRPPRRATLRDFGFGGAFGYVMDGDGEALVEAGTEVLAGFAMESWEGAKLSSLGRPCGVHPWAGLPITFRDETGSVQWDAERRCYAVIVLRDTQVPEFEQWLNQQLRNRFIDGDARRDPETVYERVARLVASDPANVDPDPMIDVPRPSLLRRAMRRLAR